METNLLKALYYQKKFMTIQFHKLNPKNSGMSNSLVYALANDCYPIYHASEEYDLYSDCFEIKKERIKSIVDFLDNYYVNKKSLTFYELEEHFGGKSTRVDLIIALRYSALDNRFSGSDFWNNLDSDAPIEAQELNKEFDGWEL